MIGVLAVVCFFGGAVFMATYHLLAPWWRTETGRNVMSLTGAVTGFALLRCLALVFGDGFVGQDVLRVAMFLGAGGSLWWRWAIVLRAQLPRRDDDVQ